MGMMGPCNYRDTQPCHTVLEATLSRRNKKVASFIMLLKKGVRVCVCVCVWSGGGGNITCSPGSHKMKGSACISVLPVTALSIPLKLRYTPSREKPKVRYSF